MIRVKPPLFSLPPVEFYFLRNLSIRIYSFRAVLLLQCEEKIESRLMATQHWSKNHRGGGESVCCACLEVLPISRLSRHILKSHHAPSKPAREPRAPKGDGSGGQRGRPKGAKGDPKVISYDQKCPVCLSKYKCASVS